MAFPKQNALKPSSLKTQKQMVIEEEKFQESFNSVAQNLWTNSSIYAVTQIANARGRDRQLLWCLVLFVGLVGCLYESYRFLGLYFQYPVVITLEVENSWKLQFPAVTVCNLNRIPVFYYDCILSNLTLPECERMKCEQRYKKARPAYISERRKFSSCSNLFDGVFNDQHIETLLFLNRYLNLSKEERRKVGYKASSFIKSCSFNGESCSSRNFSDFLSTQFGNCFTFNGKSNKKSIETSYNGPNSGLEISLNLHHADYISLSSSIGARVVIHEHGAEPNPEDYGINISPGFETSLSIKQESVYRLPYPYRDNCKQYDANTLNEPQNQEVCLRDCMQRENFRQCGCVDPLLPAKSFQSPCDLRNLISMCCLEEVMMNLTKGFVPCYCPLSCKSTHYEMTISTAQWPSFQYYMEFMKTMLAPEFPCRKNDSLDSNPVVCDSYCEEEQYLESRKEIAKLKVFFQSLEKSYYKQEPMFQESELFSQLGGQLGLWLGVSLVALFECVENVSHLTRHFLKKHLKLT